MGMRPRAGAILLLLGILPLSVVRAQRAISPDSLRPPLVLDSSADVRRMTAVRLQIHQLEQAIQRADTLQLMAVLGDAVVPDSEVAVARRRGCPSLGWALRETRRTRGASATATMLPLGRLVLSVRQLSVGPDGSATADLRLQDVRSARRDYGVLRVEYERGGDATLPRRALGLRAVLCGLALAP
jgi:hypothetical protein